MNPLRSALLLLVFAGGLPGKSSAQGRPGQASGKPSSAVGIASSVGEVRFANSGAAAAQTAFLKGLAQLHNFEYEAAAKLFRRAQALDPGFAMAYWGEAMTYNHPIWMQQDRAAAMRVLARLGSTPAARAAKADTLREKAYLHALEVLYGDGEKYARDFAYAEAMAELHAKFPEDNDAAAFYALSLLGSAHEGRDFGIYMRAAAVLEPVFQKSRRHPGAAHYLIHSYDDPIHAPLGLRAARAYSKIAPAAAHAQHMCSHIFVAMGMWDEVVAANQAAVRLQNAAQVAAGKPAGACGHYPSWLLYGYLEQGRLAEAKRMLSTCYAVAQAGMSAAHSHAMDPDDSPAGSFAAMRARYLIDSEEWKSEVVNWVLPVSGHPSAEVTLSFATGFAQARSGDIGAARASLEQLRTARRALDGRLATSPLRDQVHGKRAAILEEQLAAVTEFSAGAQAPAIEKMKATAASEEKMPIEFGPPFVDKPSYELLGEMLLAAGRAAEAQAAFEKALARAPQRTTTMLGLMRAAAKAGDTKTAERMKAKLTNIWREADGLPKDFGE